MSGYAPIRDQFLRFGDLRPQGAGEWRGPFPLPPALAEFYAEVGPLGPVVYEHVGPVGVTIPGTALGRAAGQLWVRQAGYRWDGNSGERLTDWPEDWLVIADQHADPLILEMSTGRVLYAAWRGPLGCAMAGARPARWPPCWRPWAVSMKTPATICATTRASCAPGTAGRRPGRRRRAGRRRAARAFFDRLEW